MTKSKNSLKALLGATSFWMLNKRLVNKLGLETALVFQHLIDLNDSYFDGNEFYQQMTRMENDLPLSKRQISNAIKKLVEEKFLVVVKKGIPCKNYYLIYEMNVIPFMLQTSDVKFTTLEK